MVTPAQAITQQREVSVEPERLKPGGDIAAALLFKRGVNQKVKEPFTYEGRMYVAGEIFNSHATAYPLGTYEEYMQSPEWDGEINDPFDGEKLTYSRKEYYILGPPVVFAATQAASGETIQAETATDQPTAETDEAASRTLVFVDPERLAHDGDISSSHSAELLGGKLSKIRKPFEYEGDLYVVTGSTHFPKAGSDSYEAMRLVPLADYKDQTWESFSAKATQQNRALAPDEWRATGYEGVIVKHSKKEYVLAGPAVTFKPQLDSEATPVADTAPVAETPLPDVVLEERIFKETLEVPLSDEELKAKVRRHVDLKHQIIALELEAKDTAKVYKTRIENLEQEDRDNDEVLESGAERREVECRTRRDYARGVIETVRADSGVVLETRPMTTREKQRDLFAAGAAL